MATQTIQGDTLEVLATLPENQFDGACYSPPYYRQLSYGFPQEHGREPTLEEYLRTQANVLRHLACCTKRGATVFLNVADTSNNYSGIRNKKQRKIEPAAIGKRGDR
ncbi:MAG: hypothetical protein HC944_06180 [Nanoarchaeota archaeon]|nr:hypothetical protein [Nanoarchaeota archaeon]